MVVVLVVVKLQNRKFVGLLLVLGSQDSPGQPTWPIVALK